jgi:hypothetical protein
LLIGNYPRNISFCGEGLDLPAGVSRYRQSGRILSLAFQLALKPAGDAAIDAQLVDHGRLSLWWIRPTLAALTDSSCPGSTPASIRRKSFD